MNNPLRTAPVLNIAGTAPDTVQITVDLSGEYLSTENVIAWMSDIASGHNTMTSWEAEISHDTGEVTFTLYGFIDWSKLSNFS